jgi:hypothetical protein
MANHPSQHNAAGQCQDDAYDAGDISRDALTEQGGEETGEPQLLRRWKEAGRSDGGLQETNHPVAAHDQDGEPNGRDRPGNDAE